MELENLKDPFSFTDIEWRVQSSGKSDDGKVWARVLAYVTNRAIMDRLDKVLGAENWKNDFIKAPEGGVMCGLSVKIGAEWVTKWDVAANTEVKENGVLDLDTNVKGGFSASMKRAAVQWGIGRYLYNLDIGYAVISTHGAYSGKSKDGTFFKWNPPALPSWALPKEIENLAQYEKHFNEVANALLDYLNAGAFEHPGNVEKVIDDRNIAGMEKALAVAKAKKQEAGK